VREPDVRNPYEHIQEAKSSEKEGNLRRAEAQWKAAIIAADSLPMIEYKRNYRQELLRYGFDPDYESQPGVTEERLRDVYCDLLALPFSTRMHLASFYARNGAYPEAKEASDQAFAFGMDALAKEHAALKDFWHRAEIMRDNIAKEVGPENLQSLIEEQFKVLDADGDGYLHESELRNAQYNLMLPADCQKAIKYLLDNYREVEAAYKDEFPMDIRGISRRDVQEHDSKKNTTWKRLPPKR
jgi:hypothetical protein